RTRTWQAPPRPPRRRARRPLVRSAFGLRVESRVGRGRGCTGATRTAPGRLSRAGAHHRTHPSRRTGRSAACSGSSRSPVSADPIAFEVGGAQARRRAVRYTEGPRPTRVCFSREVRWRPTESTTEQEYRTIAVLEESLNRRFLTNMSGHCAAHRPFRSTDRTPMRPRSPREISVLVPPDLAPLYPDDPSRIGPYL